MKNGIRKAIAMMLILMVALSATGYAAKLTPSKGFKLPAVKVRPTAAPEATPAPEAPADPEATEAPEVVEPAPEGGAAEGIAYVKLSNPDEILNIRAAASLDAEKISYVHHGVAVTVLGTEGEWTKIRAANGDVGYVASRFLTAEAPEAEAPAEPEAPEATELPELKEDLKPVEEKQEEPAAEEPVEETAEEAVPVEGLRQIIVLLREGETEMALYAEASADSEVLAMIPAGEILFVKDIEAEWSYAVYGETEGYVLTDKIALYNEETTEPEEEEIIRTITVSSSIDGLTEVAEGTIVTLTAKLTGFENDEYTVSWQYTPDGGATVIDVEGANELSHSFPITVENADYLWRVCITLKADVEVQPEAE